VQESKIWWINRWFESWSKCVEAQR